MPGNSFCRFVESKHQKNEGERGREIEGGGGGEKTYVCCGTLQLSCDGTRGEVSLTAKTMVESSFETGIVTITETQTGRDIQKDTQVKYNVATRGLTVNSGREAVIILRQWFR